MAGFGEQFLSAAIEYGDTGWTIARVECCVLFVFYMLDAEQWSGKFSAKLRNLTFMFICCCAIVYWTIVGLKVPNYLILVYTLGIPGE